MLSMPTDGDFMEYACSDSCEIMYQTNDFNNFCGGYCANNHHHNYHSKSQFDSTNPNSQLYDIDFEQHQTKDGHDYVLDTDTGKVYWEQQQDTTTNKVTGIEDLKVDAKADIASNNASNNGNNSLNENKVVAENHDNFSLKNNKVDISPNYNVYNDIHLPPSPCKEGEAHCWIKDGKGDIKGEYCKKGEDC